jgi:chorismate mutase
VPSALRALRGATTVDEDTPEQITERVVALLQEMMDRNGVDHDDMVSIIFTATPDIHSMFPPAAARTIGLGDVPLLGASELDVEGGVQRCIRVMIHMTTERSRSELRHVYLEGAKQLRDDLPG